MKSSLYQEHINITNEVKSVMQALKVVFPAQYGKLYTQAADARDIKLTPNELLAPELLDEKMVRHVVTLSDCTNRAILAIETENKDDLAAILAETHALQQEIQELQKIVYEDSLTKSYNRKWFDDIILNKDQVALRDSGTLVMVDLNKFKEINDTYGHIVGDKVLVHVAMKLKGSGGRVVRYGGDEFIVIFDSKIAFTHIEKELITILQYYEKIHFQIGEQSFKVSFAYGMTSFKDGDEVVHVIEAADKAMYDNKHKNR